MYCVVGDLFTEVVRELDAQIARCRIIIETKICQLAASIRRSKSVTMIYTVTVLCNF